MKIMCSMITALNSDMESIFGEQKKKRTDGKHEGFAENKRQQVQRSSRDSDHVIAFPRLYSAYITVRKEKSIS